MSAATARRGERQQRTGGVVTVIVCDDVMTQANRRVLHVPVHGPCALGEVVARAVNVSADEVRTDFVVVAGDVAGEAQLDALVQPGTTVLAARRVGFEPVSIGLLAISLAATAASALLARKVRLPRASDNRDAESQRYSFRGVSTDAEAGESLPVVFGTVLRWGGKVIQVEPIEATDGSGDTALRMLVAVSSGGHAGIGGIGNQSSDFDALPGDQLQGVYLQDNQPLSTFRGVRAWGRMGTAGQRAVPGFENPTLTREVGAGGLTLRNTSGSDRSGGTPSGEAVSFTTLNVVGAARLRVSFPRGLYQTTQSTQLETRRVQWRYRWRTVTLGAQTWSAWTVVTVDKATQSELTSSVRIENTDGAAPTRIEIQAERVTAEPSDLAIVDQMVFSSVVEITYDEQRYAGVAVLALEIPAQDQVTSRPRVSADVRGLKVRVWDGVSGPGSFTSTRAVSSNPAAIALELLTSGIIGAGSYYREEDVITQSLLDFWARCDEPVARRRGSGTRPRFACNLVMDQERPVVEWLRLVCETAWTRPVTLGKRWAFVCDREQTLPAETFTDGDLLQNDDNEPDLALLFESTRGEFSETPNQWTAQYASDSVQGRTEAIVYPQTGQSWLGGETPEPARSRSVRLDGITDDEQVADHLVYLAKRERALDLAVEFRTSRPVVKCQPGDRIDLSFALPGWGEASGLLEPESTASVLILDRRLVVRSGSDYWAQVTMIDGSVVARKILNAPGVYPKGSAVGLQTALPAAPAAFSPYAVGPLERVAAPFICTSVKLVDPLRLIWQLSGVAYDARTYDREVVDFELPDYSSLPLPGQAPGPVSSLRVVERVESGQRNAELSWTQTPEDALITTSVRIYRRRIGTFAWVRFPVPSVAQRAAVFEITDQDFSYEFVAVAVSRDGYALSPDDPRHPRASLRLGFGIEPPPPPPNVQLTQTGGNTYTLSWDAVPEAAGYQVLYGGTTSARPNDGAEDCLVLTRTTATSVAGLELAPGQSHRFYVRSYAGGGRLSRTTTGATLSSAATPAGETVKFTWVPTLASDGTRTNLTWNASTGRLELTDPAAEGVWEFADYDTGAATLTEITLRPLTANDADEAALVSGVGLEVPSTQADQWGVVDTSATVGMLMPPWPDVEHQWALEVRLHDGSSWGPWQSLDWCDSLRQTVDRIGVRVRLRRTNHPYAPALRGITIVGTN